MRLWKEEHSGNLDWPCCSRLAYSSWITTLAWMPPYKTHNWAALATSENDWKAVILFAQEICWRAAYTSDFLCRESYFKCTRKSSFMDKTFTWIFYKVNNKALAPGPPFLSVYMRLSSWSMYVCKPHMHGVRWFMESHVSSQQKIIKWLKVTSNLY